METCPINPDCAARLARLEERSKTTAKTLDRVEGKVDLLKDSVWGVKLRVAVIAAMSGGTVAGLLKIFHFT
jgi:hypothetical protein